jgi:hypothetical protein
VIAWLGDGNDSSGRAIEALLQIRMISVKPDFWPEGLLAIPLSWGGRDITSLTDSTWKDINMLLIRDWFRRSGIVQELILASNVSISCGRWNLSWDGFFEALKTCRNKAQIEIHSNLDHGLIVSLSDPVYAFGLPRQSRIMLNDVTFD